MHTEVKPTFVVYSRPLCLDCQTVEEVFHDYGVTPTKINILQDPTALTEMLAINGGEETVPTILFVYPGHENLPGVMMEPSREEFVAAMEASGFEPVGQAD